MLHLSTTTTLLKPARRGALLLALAAAGPAAWGQSFGPVASFPTVANSVANRAVLADMDGDGRVDIVTANNGAGSVSVLPGLGNGRFAAPTSYPAGANYQLSGLAVGDLNADGRPDIVVGDFDTDMVGVLLGQAGNTFAPVTFYSSGMAGGVYHLVLSDVNNDGRLDIVTTNKILAVGVLLGQAGGTFAPAMSYSTRVVGVPLNLAIGDINGDGRSDIVTTSQSMSSVGLLLGQAGNTFAPAVSVNVGIGGNSYGVALGDVNSDSRLDIVLTNASTEAVAVMLGSGGGTFAAAVTYQLGRGIGPYGVVLRDVNGDGRLDIITANTDGISVGVLLGQAGGTFASVVLFPVRNIAGVGPIEVAVGDVNGDGRPDIVSPNYGSVDVLLNTGTYTPLATARPAAADLTLAPNPAHDSFVVTLPAALAPTQAELLNSLGQVVRRPAVGSATSFRVETTGLAPGLYTLRLRAGGAALARRVVVE